MILYDKLTIGEPSHFVVVAVGQREFALACSEQPGLELRLAVAFEQEHSSRAPPSGGSPVKSETPAYAPIIAELLEHCPRAKLPRRWKDAAAMEFQPRRPRRRVADSMREPSVSSGKRGK
jgi:hypothetical protein